MTEYKNLTDKDVAAIKQAKREEKAELAIRSAFGAESNAVAVKAAGGRMGVGQDVLTLREAEEALAAACTLRDRRIASAGWDGEAVTRVERQILTPWVRGQESERAQLDVDLEDAVEDQDEEAQRQFEGQIRVTDALIEWGKEKIASLG